MTRQLLASMGVFTVEPTPFPSPDHVSGVPERERTLHHHYLDVSHPHGVVYDP